MGESYDTRFKNERVQTTVHVKDEDRMEEETPYTPGLLDVSGKANVL